MLLNFSDLMRTGILKAIYIKIILFFPGFPESGTAAGNVKPAEFKLAKNDLIAELKLSHNVGGVSKLRTEQQKMQEEQEKVQYKKFLAQFTMENFLPKVSND